jgi:ribosomal protein L12E/L44/L45/RPP1/RPP2
MITRDTIIDAVVSVVENNVISQTPRAVSEEQLKEILDSGREGLVATANAIADKLLNKSV